MNVQAIWENGVLRPLQPLYLKHPLITIQVPDEEVEFPANTYDLPPEVIERAKAMLARMEAIRNAPLPPDDELPELTEKQLERIEAFELRDEIKAMR
jgi:predicted DNA-binding antitoxin AbrB/MazE fold protein